MIEHLSKSNASLARSLHRRKGRREHGAYLAEGARALDELARAGVRPRFVFGHDDQTDLLATLFPETRMYVADARMSAVFATDSAQGLAAVIDIPQQPSLSSINQSDEPLLVLDGVSDPGNVGTIVRSAAWFGLAAVVLVHECADAFGPKAVRASMGAVALIPVVDATVDDLVALGRDMFALDSGGERTLGTAPLERRAIYVVGSEAHGVSREIAERSESIAIAGTGAVESLNAAVAASILCFALSSAHQ